ncbi:hypothetical protein [Nocardioides mangrovi]|uniref:DNA-binding protein n=1 Tax=Nocardioides mangrovi TaxID=2874580 RepID=A0ABS7UFX9_9ACTN|nr:hypothetical protein [Nocardioides mangrovi]MBZ5739777.1 hypothetical protein [Nocardioides mangrovi]
MGDSPPSLLIRRTDVPAVYGLDARLIRRLCEEHRLSRVYPMGPTGAVYLYRAELDALIAESTIPPGQKAGR